MYARYVALGDSQTEGLNDGDELTGYRGWADRLAERMAAVNPSVQYANLAIRGKLAGQVRYEQLDAALSLRPDVATVVAGLNDVLRPRVDMAEVVADLDATFAALVGIGATVATLTFPDPGKVAPAAKRLLPRVLTLNEGIRSSAARHGVLVAETYDVEVCADPRIWSPDRIHASPLGHDRISHLMGHALGLADDSWRLPLPPVPARTRRQRARAEYDFYRAFALPWIGRRIRGVSSGDGRSPKRPELLPVLAQG